MTAFIGRRDLITLLGGAAVAWPLAARAQQSGVPVIGFLRSTSLAASAPMIAGFRQGLTATGFNERLSAKTYQTTSGEHHEPAQHP